jgi:4-aminobutyrate aminotransferase
MDFHGNSVHQIGHAHPKVIKAVKRQLDDMAFCPRRFTNRPAIALAERLAGLSPGNLAKVLFAPGGTAAIGVAMKLARYATGRHKTVSMHNSFHGASMDAISVGGEALFRDGLGPLLPGCFHVAWPSAEADADAIEKILVKEGDIGAVIAEPMRCTTIDRPPHNYWRRIRQLCDEHGALLVFDEIPLALGRTGRMFCCEHSDVTPDILVIGKGLGGGMMPMAATLVRADLDIVPQRALGHYTHEKSPVGAAAALTTLDVIDSENLLERSRKLGAATLDELRDLQRRHDAIIDVRGLGLAMGVELSSPDAAERVLYDCLANGLSFKVSGGTVLTLTPPLTITDKQMTKALAIIDAALAQL